MAIFNEQSTDTGNIGHKAQSDDKQDEKTQHK